MTKGLNLIDFIEKNIKISDAEKEFVTELDELYNSITNLPIGELIPKAEDFLVKLFSKYDGLHKLFFKLALRFDDENLFEEAIFFYRVSNLLNPNPQSINNLAVIYYNTNRIDEAKKILEYGLKLFPDHEEIKENLLNI